MGKICYCYRTERVSLKSHQTSNHSNEEVYKLKGTRGDLTVYLS